MQITIKYVSDKPCVELDTLIEYFNILLKQAQDKEEDTGRVANVPITFVFSQMRQVFEEVRAKI